MNQGRSLLLTLLAVAGILSSATEHNHQLCKGIVEENTMNIPVNADASLMNADMSEQEFNRIIDIAEKFYTPVIAELGGELDIRRNWSSGTVNAYANRSGNTYMVTMFGGLARHRAVTADAFLLVLCHEIGHHLGGAPKYGGGQFNDWATNEGQADYFGNLKCMRNVLTDEDNARWVSENSVPEYLRTECETMYNSIPEENLCMRASMAGLSLAVLFQDLRSEETAPDFNTPDPTQVNETSDDHPGTQCRLDTYFQASLCIKDKNEGLSDSDPLPGTCNLSQGFLKGVRPHCWFKAPAI